MKLHFNSICVFRLNKIFVRGNDISFLKNTRALVFWPPAIMLGVCVIAGVLFFDSFLRFANGANTLILTHLDWAFSWFSFAAVLVVIVVVLSPLGRVRIGGEDARPILSRWNWFAITLCTTIAIGILFWGTAEPMFHLSQPPGFTGASPSSAEAAQFALSTLYLHWTFTPYAIYALPSLAFALAYYNYRKPYSLGGPLRLLFSKEQKPATNKNDHNFAPQNDDSFFAGDLLDAFSLMALVAGVAAALGTGVMSVVGGIEAIFGIHDNVPMRLLVTAAIVSAFIFSAVSGLQKGIKWLSDANTRIFIVLAAFVLLAGPTLEIIQLSASGLRHYVDTFLSASLAFGERGRDPWTHAWTVYFFANWLAWAPVTALFLGRISIGYTVREFILFNLLIPALFSIFWMSIFGGAAISLNWESDGALITALGELGPEAVVYALLEALPLFSVVGVVFLLTVFISFVTAMDSNTYSITGLCIKSSLDEEKRGPLELRLKIFWGMLIGSLSFIMTATTGIEGVRLLSNLGGVPGLVVLIISGILLLKMVWIHMKKRDA